MSTTVNSSCMSGMSIEKSVRDPKSCQEIVNALDVAERFRNPVWVYKYRDTARGWLLSVATHAEPNSHKFSLGGFRIAPQARASAAGYDNDAEAIGLGVGMEGKVYWSRMIKVSGPRGAEFLDRVVGGKCVLLPTPGARVGEPQDFAILDFAIACLKDLEETAGIHLTTGEDLGHGIMSDGRTNSLRYMYERFEGSVLADTSEPTAEGNFHTIAGALEGLGIKMSSAQIGLIGCGNVGWHLFERLQKAGAGIFVLETSELKRKALEERGIPTWGVQDKLEFLSLPLDVVALNAIGGSLDEAAIKTINANEAIEFVCGSENLVMPVKNGRELLREARKIYCPTELSGMMGYLTAVEEYHARQAGEPFKVDEMFEPARKLHDAARKAVELVLNRNFSIGFDRAVEELFSDA